MSYLRRITIGVSAVLALFIVTTFLAQTKNRFQPSWTEFAFPDSNVVVSMPVKSTKFARTETARGVVIEDYTAEWNGMRSSIMTMRFPDKAAPTTATAKDFLDQLILAAKSGMITNMQLIGDPRPLDLPGVIGVEYRSVYAGERKSPIPLAMNRTFILMDDPVQVFVTMVAYNYPRENHASISKFLNSFQIKQAVSASVP